MSNDIAWLGSYNMALGLGDKVGVMWPGIIWLILSTYHNKYQSGHKRDNTQVKTSLQAGHMFGKRTDVQIVTQRPTSETNTS